MKYLLLIFICYGCYLPKKAERQLNKVEKYYPELVAKKSKELYPVTERIDSVEFVKWKDSISYVITSTSDTFINYHVDTNNYGGKYERRLKSLILLLKNAPAKIVYLEDSAKIYLINSELKKSNIEKSKYEKKYLFWIQFSICILILLVLLLAALLFKSYYK